MIWHTLLKKNGNSALMRIATTIKRALCPWSSLWAVSIKTSSNTRSTFSILRQNSGISPERAKHGLFPEYVLSVPSCKRCRRRGGLVWGQQKKAVPENQSGRDNRAGCLLVCINAFRLLRELASYRNRQPPAMPVETQKLNIKNTFSIERSCSSYRPQSKRCFCMAKEQNLAHTKWLCKYHIVFTPMYRRKVIHGQYREEIGKIIRQFCTYKGVEIIEGTWRLTICCHDTT